MEDAKVILRNYMRSKKAVRDIGTFGEAQNYAEKLGKALADVLGNDFEGVAEEDLASVLRVVLKKVYDDSAVAAASAQYRQNQKAKLGIGILRADLQRGLHKVQALAKIAGAIGLFRGLVLVGE